MAQKRNRVFIVNSGQSYREMFEKEGWDVVKNICNADLVQFTGGWDVDPALYKEHPHPATHCFPLRDKKEIVVFKLAYNLRMPMAGICRGGQLLNVLCGGKMYQDVDGHSVSGTHSATDTRTGESFPVTSTHHQMMIPKPGKDAEIILTAAVSTMLERMSNATSRSYSVPKRSDVEAVWYPKFKAFCFQPHPEFPQYRSLARRYFDYLEEFFNVGAFIAKA